jgi:hypothetical protein
MENRLITELFTYFDEEIWHYPFGVSQVGSEEKSYLICIPGVGGTSCVINAFTYSNNYYSKGLFFKKKQ